MRIAIDNRALKTGHAVRGIGMMLDQQLQALNDQLKRFENIEIDQVDFTKADLGKYDIVYYPYFFPFSLTLPPQKPAAKVVVMIQDLIQLIYPQKYPPGVRGKICFYQQKKRLKYVDAVITITNTSKKDIVRFLDIPAEKIYTIYLASKEIFKPIDNKKRLEKVRKKYHLPDKFVLYVGDVNYNKNIPNLIKACGLAKTALVIVGKQAKLIDDIGFSLMELKGPKDYFRFLFEKPHPEQAHYSKIIRNIRRNKNIYRPGFVSDDDLAVIYNLASVYVQPSFYEGFGLPVLEAMKSGFPVIISRTNALTEVADNAALVVDPKDPQDISRNIKLMIGKEKLKNKYIKLGINRAQDFSWQKTAMEMIEVFSKVASF